MDVVFRSLSLMFGFGLCALSAQADTLEIFAPASLHPVLTDIAQQFELQTTHHVELTIAPVTGLAKYIRQHDSPHLLFSDNDKWWDELDKKKYDLIETTPPVELLTNQLVLVVPQAHPQDYPIYPHAPWADNFEGELCMGAPDQVPVGRYGKQALNYFGLWDTLKKRTHYADNEHEALTQLEQGDCDLAIVYRTDALNNPRVRIATTFPLISHETIVYQTALVKPIEPIASVFLRYLQSVHAQKTFKRYGFGLANKRNSP
jgi:molybdate transport system substrate-binding protein